MPAPYALRVLEGAPGKFLPPPSICTDHSNSGLALEKLNRLAGILEEKSLQGGDCGRALPAVKQADIRQTACAAIWHASAWLEAVDKGGLSAFDGSPPRRRNAKLQYSGLSYAGQGAGPCRPLKNATQKFPGKSPC
jgi:hypothetical protein